jgi:hypothetical protein
MYRNHKSYFNYNSDRIATLPYNFFYDQSSERENRVEKKKPPVEDHSQGKADKHEWNQGINILSPSFDLSLISCQDFLFVILPKTQQQVLPLWSAS